MARELLLGEGGEAEPVGEDRDGVRQVSRWHRSEGVRSKRRGASQRMPMLGDEEVKGTRREGRVNTQRRCSDHGAWDGVRG